MRPSVWRIAVCLLAATSQFARAQARPRESARFAEARHILREGMAKDSVPATAVAVVRDGAIIWEEGFGWADRANRVPATPNTPFLLASVTKTFEATAAVVLQQQGRIDLDHPVNDYLRTAGLFSYAWDPRAATLRQLITHTSGLTTFDLTCDADSAQASCRFPSADDVIRRYGVIVWPPGDGFDYSNLGYFVLGEALARATGKPLATLLRDEVFVPLGMTHSTLALDSALARQTVIPFSWVQGLVRPKPVLPDSSDYRSVRGYASVHDLALFAAFQMKAHRPNQRPILSDSAIDAMQTSTVGTGSAGSSYGLGWWIEENRFGYRSLLAQGGNDRTNVWLRMIPTERIAVTVAANKGVGFPEDVVDEVIATLLARYREGLEARRRERAQSATAAAQPPAAPKELDSTLVGSWTGTIHAADGDVPIDLSIAATGEVQATIGARTDVGRARVGDALLVIRIPGDLEAPNPAGKSRQISFYLRRWKDGFAGAVTTRPLRSSGLDGAVSYWVDVRRR